MRNVGYRKAFETIEKDGQWSKVMFKILKEMGETKGYNIVEGRGNELNLIDQCWFSKRGKLVAAIEHENYGDKNPDCLNPEISKLIYVDAPLRILVTYVKELSNGTEEILSKINKSLKNRKEFRFEFILMAGQWEINDPKDFICYRFRPTWKREMIS